MHLAQAGARRAQQFGFGLLHHRGTLTVQADGSASFDDTGFSWPAQGSSMFDSVIATVSDGQNNVFVSVNVQLNHL